MFAPTIGAAIRTGRPWLTCYCPGCGVVGNVDLMPLFWLVHEIDEARVVRVQEGGALIFARLRASIDDFAGTFVMAHELDAKTAKRITKKAIGRVLKAGEGTPAGRPTPSH